VFCCLKLVILKKGNVFIPLWPKAKLNVQTNNISFDMALLNLLIIFRDQYFVFDCAEQVSFDKLKIFECCYSICI